MEKRPARGVLTGQSDRQRGHREYGEKRGHALGHLLETAWPPFVLARPLTTRYPSNDYSPLPERKAAEAAGRSRPPLLDWQITSIDGATTSSGLTKGNPRSTTKSEVHWNQATVSAWTKTVSCPSMESDIPGKPLNQALHLTAAA